MKNFGVYMEKGSNGGVSEVKKFYWEHQFVNGVEKNFGNTNHIFK